MLCYEYDLEYRSKDRSFDSKQVVQRIHEFTVVQDELYCHALLRMKGELLTLWLGMAQRDKLFVASV